MRSSFRHGIFIALLGCGVVGFAGDANAAVVFVTPDNTNRIIAGSGLENFHFSGTFSTYNSGGETQRTLLQTTNATFLAALVSALGPSPSYQINSAELVVGNNGENYSATGPAFRMLRDWDPSDVTWNDPDPNDSLTATGWGAAGVQANTDYATPQLTNGTIFGNTTEFQNLGSTVQDWLDADFANDGLFFTETAGSSADFTGADTVFWRIDATVPEPSAPVLAAASGLIALRRRRYARSRRN